MKKINQKVTDLFFACNKTTINYILALVSQQVINDYLHHVLFIIILYQIKKKFNV